MSGHFSKRSPKINGKHYAKKSDTKNFYKSKEFKLKMNWYDGEGCVISGALVMVLKLSRLFGIAPLNFESRRNGVYITISRRIFYLSCILAVALGAISVSAVALDLTKESSRSVRVSTTMTATVFVTEVLLMNFTTFLGVFGAPKSMRQFINIRKYISKIEMHLYKECEMKSERKLMAAIIVFLATAYFLLLSDYYINLQRAGDYNKDLLVAYMYTGFFIQIAMTFVQQLQFVLVALSIQKCIRSLNDAFEDVSQYLYVQAFHENQVQSIVNSVTINNKVNGQLTSINGFVNSITNEKNKKIFPSMGSINVLRHPDEVVMRLASLHSLLCDLVQQTNSSYGVILIAFLLNFLIHLIMSPYYLILQLQDSQRRLYKLALQFIWCLFHMINMFLVVEPCHRTISEFTRTQEIASRVMRFLKSNTNQLAVQLELFSRQLLLRFAFYSPLGMCKLNRRLITSIIGGVTTYLVILLQFQKLSEINDSGSV